VGEKAEADQGSRTSALPSAAAAVAAASSRAEEGAGEDSSTSYSECTSTNSDISEDEDEGDGGARRRKPTGPAATGAGAASEDQTMRGSGNAPFLPTAVAAPTVAYQKLPDLDFKFDLQDTVLPSFVEQKEKDAVVFEKTKIEIMRESGEAAGLGYIPPQRGRPYV